MTDLAKLCFDGLPGEPLAYALAYASVFEIFPLGFDAKTRKRKPLTEHAIKDATQDAATIKNWWAKTPHADIGLVVPPDLAVLDLDAKNNKNGRRDFERVTGLLIDALETPIATTPSGGLHIWCRTNGVRFTAETEIDGLGIDFCANGKNGRCVIAPAPGVGRMWRNPPTAPIMDAPQFFVEWMKAKAAQRAQAGQTGRTGPHPFTGETRRARKALDTACDALSKAPSGRRDAAIGKHVLRVGSLAGAGEMHAEGALDELLDAARRNPGAAQDYFDKIKRAFAAGLGAPAPQRTKAPKADWLERAIKNDFGEPLPILANALAAIRYTTELAGALAYDELLRATVLVAELPIVVGAKLITGRPLPRPVIDEDVSQLQEWLQHAGMPRIGRDTVHQAVDRHSRDSSFHKLREWLRGLEWDGTPRLEKWLTVYLGADPTPYHCAIGKMFLIAMAARIFEPGCQADYVPILQGPQGDLKSTACRVLAGDHYFSDNLPDIRSKDANQFVRGLWLIELPELSALSRGDIDAWKAFITRRIERYRPFYGRLETIENRQCSFIGTTNRDEYLQDETGNRRFWPVLTGKIDIGALKRDRERLFAEAVHCYRNKERWWPDQEFERKHIKPEQDARYEEDPWTPLIAEIFTNVIITQTTRVCDVARKLGIENSRIGTADARRIRRVLHRLGWRQPSGPRATADRFYHRPVSNEEDE